jgi:predicted DNA-binding transcriptional regulator AlpA
MNLRVSMRQEPGGSWAARTMGRPEVRASGSTREACLGNLRRSLARTLRTGSGRQQPVTLVVEVIPELAGVAEAAEVMGWDKRRVITYIDRGRFPAPIQALASGRVWVRSDVEDYAASWKARRRRRR